MCMFVGPAQSASRSFLARLIPEGKSGEVFGLYATTGRVVSFLSPALFGIAIAVGARVTGQENTQYWGILGIVVVLAIGLAVMIPVEDAPNTAACCRNQPASQRVVSGGLQASSPSSRRIVAPTPPALLSPAVG